MTMTNAQVAHLWAQQQRDEGRGSNLFFGGPTIFSYGRHFPIARFLRKPRGHVAGIVLFTTRSYSVTTAKHKSLTRDAIHSSIVIRVPDVLVRNAREHGENAKTLLKEALEFRAKVLRSRSRWNFQNYTEKIENLKTYLSFPGIIRIPASIRREIESAPFEFTEAERVKWEAKVARAEGRAVQQGAADERRRIQAMDASEKLELWKRGEVENMPYHYGLPVALRLRGDTVQTSLGAEVSISEARILYRLIKRGTPVHGFRIGDFTVISCNGVLKIGCHEIERSEVERVGELILGMKDNTEVEL